MNMPSLQCQNDDFFWPYVSKCCRLPFHLSLSHLKWICMITNPSNACYQTRVLLLIAGESVVPEPSHEMEANERHANGARPRHGPTQARPATARQHQAQRALVTDGKPRTPCSNICYIWCYVCKVDII